MLIYSKYLLGLQLLLITVTLAYGQPVNCKVVRIIDGDTITCLTETKKQLKVRLANIDAPEAKQPWGSNARKKLADLIFSKDVILDIQSKDRYDRLIAVIWLGSLNINKEMVRSGNAWVYTYFNKDKELPLLEAEAKSRKIGLWSLHGNEIISPWDWRRNENKRFY